MSNSTNGSGHAFVISPAQINLINKVELGFAIPGACVCFLVLLSFAFAALVPRARRKLDRVSFRLLAYTLVFHVSFGIAFVAVPSAPGHGCIAGAFAVNLFLCLSTFFTTCIAINLQLVLVHGVDGRRMEKYYVIGTILLSLVLNVLPLALNQFGWDKASSVCWYKNRDNTKRLHWLIGTQSFWISLAATIEAVCSAIVLVWMYRFNRNTMQLIKAVSQSTLNRGRASKTSDATVYRHAWSSRSSASTQLTQYPRYRNLILRIALYPIVSLIMNYSTVALDLNNMIKGLKSELDYRLLLLDLIMYGLRTLAYGLLAAMDPAFISAVKEIRSGWKEEGTGRAGVYMLTTFEFAPGRGKSEAAAMTTTEQLGEMALAGKKDVEGVGGEREVLDEEKRKLERQL